MTEQPQPWDRMPGETDTQYQQFLCYRDIGPTRSRSLAWEDYCTRILDMKEAPKSPAGAFMKALRDNDWRERAALWDIHNLGPVYVEIGRDYLRGVQAVARQAAEAAEETGIDDLRWDRILEMLSFVGKHLEPAIKAGVLGTPPPAIAHAGASQTMLPPRVAEAGAADPDAGWK